MKLARVLGTAAVGIALLGVFVAPWMAVRAVAASPSQAPTASTSATATHPVAIQHPATTAPGNPASTPSDVMSAVPVDHATASTPHPATAGGGSGAVIGIALVIVVCIGAAVFTLYRQSRRGKSVSVDQAGSPGPKARQGPARGPTDPEPVTKPTTPNESVAVPVPVPTGTGQSVRVQVLGPLPAGITAVRSVVAHSGLNPSGLILIDGFLIVRATALPGQAPVRAGTPIDLFQSDGTRVPRST